MKKKIGLVLCAILLCSSCGADIPRVSDITHTSIDMPGEIDGGPKQTTAQGQDNFQGTSQNTINGYSTKAPIIEEGPSSTSIIDDEGNWVVITSEVTYAPIIGDYEVTAAPATGLTVTRPDETTVVSDLIEPRVPTTDNLSELNGRDLDAYYNMHSKFGYENDAGEKYSTTGELITRSSMSYEQLINQYSDEKLHYSLTLHYGDHYETYWFRDNRSYSVLQEGSNVFTTYSELYTSTKGIEYEDNPITDLKEGDCSDIPNVEGRLLGMYNKVFHKDYYHTIFYDEEAEKYIVYDRHNNAIYIKEKS